MPNPRTPRLWWMIAMGSVVLGIAAQSDESEPIERLRSMPIERRAALVEKLARFRELSRDERDRIRELDRRLQVSDTHVRGRYRELLRIFELFVDSLDEETRRHLLSTPPEERMGRLRATLESSLTASQSLDGWLGRYWNPSAPSILDQVYWIRSWYALTPEEQVGLESLPLDERSEILEARAQQNAVRDERDEIQEQYQAELLERVQAHPVQRELFESLQPADRKVLLRRLVDVRVLQDLEPEANASGNLTRFVATLPAWMLAWVDPMPPDAARERLGILYRLAFPAGSDLPKVLDPNSRPVPRPTPPEPARAETSPIETPF